MERESLLQLLHTMSLEDKVGQVLQLTGNFLEEGGKITGPIADMGITEEQTKRMGSILGTIGAAKLKRIQKDYLDSHPHGIPLLFMTDIINGYKTIFPIPLAQGCTFEPEVAEEAASVAARESAAAGLHVTFSPMVDLVRDARWGRVMESTGEDTYLNSLFAEAMVKGYQGDDISQKGRIAACVKHFAGYGLPTAGRDYNNVELSERTFREDYLPAYEAGIKAGSELVMTSFNTLDRIPSTGNKKLMRKILREEMGFAGVLISDWAAIEEMLQHGIVADKKEAARLAMEAGVDIDMMTTCYIDNLQDLIKEGIVSEELLDEAVLRILELKNKLGLFENPYKDADEEEEQKVLLSAEHRTAARETAVKSFVLLKNEEMLPLKQEESTAFIGPYVDHRWIHGVWSMFAKQQDNVTLREGIMTRTEGINATFSKGCHVMGRDQRIADMNGYIENDMTEEACDAALQEAVRQAGKADKVVLALGEHAIQSGEASSRADITLADVQLELLDAVAEVNPNITVVLFNGRPLDLRRVEAKAKAILEVWFPGTEGGNAIADVLYGDCVPAGKLTMSFPYCVGQVPVFYNEFSTGRPASVTSAKDRFGSVYLDIPNEPLYPFGYGLSYTEFAYSEVSVDKKELRSGEELRVSVKVKNTGSCTGAEVVQLYVRDLCGSVVRPVRELKGFEKITLEPGEEREVIFRLTDQMLRFYTIDMEYRAEPGAFKVFVGGDSTTGNEAQFEYIG